MERPGQDKRFGSNMAAQRNKGIITGDMIKFSEKQKLQNMLRKCHILSSFFMARN